MRAIALTIIPLLVCALNNVRSEPIDPDYCHENKIDLIVMEPLKGGSQISKMLIKVSFSEATMMFTTIEVTIKNQANKRGRRIYGSSMVSTLEKTITFDYDQSYSNLNYENTFTFTLSGQGSDEVTLQGQIYSPQVMNIKEESMTFESNDLISIYRRGAGVSYHKEKFVFTNMVQEIYLDHTMAIDFSGVIFNYITSADYPLNYENARVVIETTGGAFSDFGSQMAISNWRKLEMEIAKNTNTGQYSIHPTVNCYVNPYTLEMVNEPLDGYIKTKYLFFPRPKSDLDTYTIRYMVEDMGANDNDFVYEFKVYVSQSLFGNCGDSCYCLTTEETYPDLESGTIINY